MNRGMNFVRSFLDPRVHLHAFRLLHFYGYAHVRERAKVEMGAGVRFSPTVSIRNGERVTIGAGAHIGERCSLWAGDSVGCIRIGRSALFGPSVYITVSNYDFDAGSPVMDQKKIEADVVIGDDVWLGAGDHRRSRCHDRRRLRGRSRLDRHQGSPSILGGRRKPGKGRASEEPG